MTDTNTHADDSAEKEPVPLIDTIREQYDAMQADETDNAETEAPESGEDDAEDTETQEAAADDEEDSEEEAGDEAADDDSEAEDADEEEGPPEAPKHWSQADKDRFDALPDDTKGWWLERTKSLEDGFQKKFNDLARDREKLSPYQELDELFEPHQQALQMRGLTPVTYVKQLAAADSFLTSNPVEGVKWIAKTYGVDLANLVPAREDPGEESEVIDPAAAQSINRLTTKVDQLTSAVSSQQQEAQTASQQQLQAQIDAFRDAKDDQGNPKHPHFDKVKTAMGNLIGTGMATSLEDAYDQALWANPELREARIAAGRAQEAQKQSKNRKAEVAKAKKATRKPKSRSTATAPVSRPGKSVRDTVAELYDEMSS